MPDFWQKRSLRESLTGYLFLAPALAVISTFVVLPILYAVFLAFHKVQLLGEVNYRFAGWRNFSRVMTDERVRIALSNTIEYVAIVVPLQTLLALLLALILNTPLKARNLFRSIFFLPTITSAAVLTLIFMWMYNTNGLLNNLLNLIGLPAYKWLGDPNIALKAIMLMNIWSTAPFFMVIYLAALQDIPETLYEAATIDGATRWEKFLYITVPFLKPITLFIVVMGVIGTFQLFDQSYIFSGGSGGPNNSTLTVVLLIYQYTFKNLNVGYAAALALILALVIMLATIMQRWLFQSETLD